ncbi:TPA: excinuclease ABC subunit C [Candidatus Uhrbacteria bacterium]|nr:MAG: excinuclease ABC subunit C [Candidatus Uhrbacteria bacterium RIFOXYB2_FULL_41_10]HAL50250.1 excinuclease ABC subunit C [Candidatus Uhrbacteria bacterium]HAN06461.1 excinuclease ABC subunit C [Candidatus Uhrbacteria bacterium]HAP66070.1 excinuclease ABC subunit C [Candidatus Uhrbacteria bacterium]HBA51586.1 excinuclease ABC subunit C [Candidatus Uhrbacteria bacterium]
MFYYVYVLQCSDRKFYIGYSSDLRNRIKTHKAGNVKSTKGRLPVNLIFYESFLHRMDAKRREKYFKTTAGKRALKLMLKKYMAEYF